MFVECDGSIICLVNVLEKIIAVVAPHLCIVCQKEGKLICIQCLEELEAANKLCYRCLKASPGGYTCPGCWTELRPTRLWAAALYNGTAKELVRVIKFSRGQGGCEQLAESMASLLELARLPSDVLLVPVVTANQRKRQRGYDQAVLIARHLAKLTGLGQYNVLIRRNDQRQVGASRTKRLSQLHGAFTVMRPSLVKERHILLVDDVITTGATLEAATTALIEAGAKTVSAVVFARA